MRRRLELAIILSTTTLSACGGGGGGGGDGTAGTSTRTPAGAAATTAPGPSAASDAAPSAAAAAKGPCSLVSKPDLAEALGGRPPTGLPDGQGCLYKLGSRQITVTATRGRADLRTFERLLRSPVTGSKVVRGGGLTSLVTTYVEPSARSGSQVQMSFVKNGTRVYLLMTDTADRAHPVTGALLRLGRATARRL